MFLKIAADTVIKQEQDGHYQLWHPFCQKKVYLPSSRKVTEQRAVTFMKRFQRDVFFADYKEFMIDLGEKACWKGARISA